MVIDAIKCKRNEFTKCDAQAIGTSDTAVEAVEKYIVFGAASTGSNGTVTVEVGDSPRAAAEPITQAVAKEEVHILTVDTGYYMQTSGENRGKILVKSTVAGMKIQPLKG